MRVACAVSAAAVWWLCAGTVASAQQRPLITEDPEAVGAGRVLIESGVDVVHGQHYPVSGLEGNLVRLPTVGISIGLSAIAEMQIDGGFYNRLSITKRSAAPLSRLLTVAGDSTSDVEDFVVGTKIRILSERAHRPAIGFRFATRLPNASNESGLGPDTTYFFASFLGAKTVQSIRIVGNLGLGILGDPSNGERQNDVLTYGASLARALSDRAELVGELNGRASLQASEPSPGTESRGLFRLGTRYTRGPIRFDGGVFFGLTPVDPTVGMTFGFTYVFHAFDLP